MGCGITVTAVGAMAAPFAEAMGDIQDLAEVWEARFSRFRAESELSQLNARAGKGPVPVHPSLFALIERAIDTARASDGLFNPLVLNAVRSVGYDRDFAELRPAEAIYLPDPEPVPGFEQVELDRDALTVSLPAGCGIDLGGIAKGAFIDAAVERLSPEWPGGCVNAGGDLRVWGVPPGDDCWTIGIEYPQRPNLDIVQIRLTDLAAASAVATSGRNFRRWQTDRGPAHHLIDPTTGAWVVGNIETASAVAADATGADLAAKTLFLSVSRQQRPLLGSASLGITIDDRGAGTIWNTDDHHHAEVVPLIVRAS